MRLVALAALLLAGCGGSPSSPSVVVPTTLPQASVARDGITGEVVNASVQHSAGMVTVTAPGFLTRTQPTAGTVYLWRQPEAFVRDVVYSHQVLRRWPAGSTVRLAFAAGLGRHDALLTEHAAEMARHVRMPVIALPAGSPGANVTLAVDPSQMSGGSLATAGVYITGGTITRVEVFFLSENVITDQRDSALLHELGHAIGLGHSPNQSDVMHANSAVPSRAFTDNETRALTMMYSWRKAGNTFPDNEPQGLSLSREVFTIACR